MDRVVVKIAKDYTRTPGPRYAKEGANSAEVFRETKFAKIVKDAIASNQDIVVDLDGAVGYGTSFLEEIFGGLIRQDNVSYDEFVKRLTIVSKEEPYLIQDIQSYLKQAAECGKK